ncbi:hypothetical protein WICPIJ_004389 [Wickerhamomyces pijperi]|uniref:Uncharacterized protein n=1 Tax=Wickerhamomyces pijperi TaxID=599730 RepID=A0A9P8TM33_WICPI|nr:hypothetical protein WICPIJ_004389 [Wickerhamomyces pijperi]
MDSGNSKEEELVWVSLGISNSNKNILVSPLNPLKAGMPSRYTPQSLENPEAAHEMLEKMMNSSSELIKVSLARVVLEEALEIPSESA